MNIPTNMQPCVYILLNSHNTTLYVGVTSDLVKRVWQHKNKFVAGFTNRYNLSKLVYYEAHELMESAISREKQMKKWKREWKDRLINEKNPQWNDLWKEVI